MFIMPLKKKNKQDSNDKVSVNYKARLEKKLYLAQESPEPVFDISHCNLKVIPSNVFALCKVLRKEALYVQNNNLTSLTSGGSLADLKFLKILNVSSNKLNQLPSSINELECLEVLDISRNEIVELPETIGDVKNLVCLNLSHNNLKQLPNSIGNCRNLEILNVSFNGDLKELPITVGRLVSLVELNIDPTITYPPKEICEKGIHEILKFLSKDLKEDVELPSTSTKSLKSVPDFSNLQEKIELHEKLKLEKQNERLRLERQLLDQNQKEIEMQQKLKNDKKKLLEDMKNQQKSLDFELTKFQEKKNIDRALLIKLCQDEEKKSSDVVGRILNVKKNSQMQFSKEWEKERKAEEAMLFSRSSQNRAFEKKEILGSMEKLMREEILKAQSASADKRLLFAQSLASEISQQNDTLNSIMQKRVEDQARLIHAIRQSEELQKSAVASLLEKSDAASWELARQISIVEAQLAELTRLEISKRKLEAECQITELSKNRIALTELLMNLLKRQAERRNQLIHTLRKMESLRESVKDSETFWMEQYDKLLNSKAHEMVRYLESIHPKLVYEFYINGVFQYLPLLKDYILCQNKLKNLNNMILTELGIKNSEDRTKILRATSSFLESFNDILPSAPLLDEPSAPLLDSSDMKQSNSAIYLVPDECVICLEAKPAVVFVPCGHICCCAKCFNLITSCPLCRKPIDAVLDRAH